MTETIQKEPDQEQKETTEAKTGGYWDELSEKVKKDAKIKEKKDKLTFPLKTDHPLLVEISFI